MILTTSRLDIFLESLAWYARQGKVRRILFRHPWFVLTDLWRYAGRRAAVRQREAAQLERLKRLPKLSQEWFIVLSQMIVEFWVTPIDDLCGELKLSDGGAA